MLFPNREYYRLSALQDKWGTSKEELLYAIENGLLRTCIWLPLRYVERGFMREQKFIYEAHELKCGYVGVRPEDCKLICNYGRADLRIFNSGCDDEYSIRMAYEPPQPDIQVRLHNLIVLKEDCEKFERIYEVKPSNISKIHPEKHEPEFVYSEDYRYVKLSGIEYHLGDVQARVIEHLHDASQSHKPWVHGKTLIDSAGSGAVRFRDIFKNKSNWRKLVVSNERGCYRLNVPLDQLHEPPADSSPERKHATN